jgi:hypothetical protein
VRVWPALLVGFVGTLLAQERSSKESDLAAAARRETERRQGAPVRTRSYGDDDLKRPEASPSPGAKPSPAPGSATAAPPAATPPGAARGGEGRRHQEGAGSEQASPGTVTAKDDRQDTAIASDDSEGWRERADAARGKLRVAQAALAANQKRLEAIRSKLNPMSPSFVTETNEQLQAQADLTDLEREAVDLQRTQSDAEATLHKVEEDARRRGVPARSLEPVDPAP